MAHSVRPHPESWYQVSSLSDAALAAASADATRDGLKIDPPTAYGAVPTTGSPANRQDQPSSRNRARCPQGGYLAPLFRGQFGAVVQFGVGAGGAAAGGAVDNAIGGGSDKWHEVVFDAAGGGAISYFTGASALCPGNPKPGWVIPLLLMARPMLQLF